MATASDRSATESYRNRLTSFQDTEVEKNEMINELIDNLENAKLDLESEKITRRRFQDRNRELESLAVSQSGGNFVLVLIDADADDYIVRLVNLVSKCLSTVQLTINKFQERFLNSGITGGRDAADELNNKLRDHLHSLDLDTINTRTMIRAYADVKGLQARCIKNEKMKSASNMYQFTHGFNQRQGLFDFVDVGPGKEKCLEFFVNISQCKHIIFGACHDTGYAPFLGKFAADASIRDRITLLRGLEVHPRITALGFKGLLKLDTVFAPHRNPGSAGTRPEVRSTSSISTSPSPGTAGPPAGPSSSLVNPHPMSERLRPIILNSEGKRVDKVLNIDIASPFIQVLRHNKLCAYYYLRGKCDGCDKNHLAQPLNAKEFDCLWYVARQVICFKARKGKVCTNETCCYGHEDGYQVGSGRVQD